MSSATSEIELYKKLESKEIELRVQLQQLTESMSTITKSINERANSNEIDTSLMNIYGEILSIIKSSEEKDYTNQDDVMSKCEDIETRLSLISSTIENEYNKINEELQNILK